MGKKDKNKNTTKVKEEEKVTQKVEKEEVKKDEKVNKKEKDNTNVDNNKNKKEENNKKEEKNKNDKNVEKKEVVKETALQKKEIDKKIKKSVGNDTKVILGVVIAVVLIAVGIFGYYFVKKELDYVVSYDGGKVSAADYEVYYKTFATMLGYYGYPDSIIPEQIANKAAIDGIIVQMAKDAGVQISEEDKASIEEVFSDKDQLDSFANQGIDIGRMKKLYENDYLITAYLEKMTEEVTDEEMLEYLKSQNGDDVDLTEYNTSHILFKTVDDSGNKLDDAKIAEQKQKAEDALKRVLNGEDFATVAKELSEDTGTKEDGGKYTFYNDGNTVEEYVNVAKNLKDGEIYPTLVETEYGYHIIKMDSKVENGRVNNTTERSEYVDNKVNALAEEKHVVVDELKLNEVVKSITGSDIPKEEEDTDSTSTDDENNAESDTTNENTNTTEGENTASE
mgnify:CR=1 FL=1